MMISNAMGSQGNNQNDVNALAGLGTAGLSGLLGKGAQKKLTQLLPLMQMLMEKVGGQQQEQDWGGHQGGHHGGHHHGGICPMQSNFGGGGALQFAGSFSSRPPFFG